MTYLILEALCLPLGALIFATLAGALLAPLDFPADRRAPRSRRWSQYPNRPLPRAAPCGRPCGG